MRSKECPSRGGGFTLIELLVVVAIIGLLSSIVFALIAVSSRNKARSASDTSGVRNYEEVLQSYYQEFGSYPNPNVSYVCIGSSSCMLLGVAYTNKAALDSALGPYFSAGLPPINNYVLNSSGRIS